MVLAASSSQQHLRASVVHDRGRLRLDVELRNDGEQPLERIRLDARYNKADLRSIDSDSEKVSHLLPGDVHEATFWLEPRASTPETLLGLRLRAVRSGDDVRTDLDLGSHSINKRGRPYQGAGNIPRM